MSLPAPRPSGSGSDRAPAGRRSASRSASKLCLAWSLAIVTALVTAMVTVLTATAQPAEAAATSVTIGNASRALNGVNVERKAQYLVAYTRTGSQTSTPTNFWGAEVTVVAGKVTAVNDRWTTRGGPTAIPAGAVVLSAHDSARLWLLANAKVGATVSAPGLITASGPGTAVPTTSVPAGNATVPPPSLIPATSSAMPAPTTTAAPTSTSTPSRTGQWMSGAAGEGVPNGQFAAWRGTSVPIVGSWSDISPDAQVQLWSIRPGLEYANWNGSMDLAVGAIFDGETWGQAAAGAYDARWAQSLQQAKAMWTNKGRGTLYLRFAHEWNGTWMKWSVKQADLGNFRTAWQRFATLKERIFPEAELVFCTNGDTVGQTYDWRAGWPGDQYVDVYATDWYAGHWKYYGLDKSDRYGGPTGLNTHRQFAAEHGKPFAVPEWGNNTEHGDQPAYIQFMRDFAGKYGGSGSGNLLYEIYFNVIWSPNQFALFPENRTSAPQASAKYKDVF